LLTKQLEYHKIPDKAIQLLSEAQQGHWSPTSTQQLSN
jgi:hypothetical protein